MNSKKVKRIIIGLVVAIALLVGGGFAARHAYISMRQARLVTKAKAYIAKSEQKKALLCLQRVLRTDPKHIEACRLMAELSEKARSPSALIWRSKVVELNPKSTEDRLALVTAALAMRDYLTATNALAAVTEAGKKTPEYHNVAGTAATLGGQLAEAQAHFLQASQLQPTNPFPRLNLAVVQLQQTNTQANSEARATLKSLCNNPEVRCQALRELISDAVRRKQSADALALSRQLLEQTNSTFSDRILRLEVLRTMQNAELKPALAAYQAEAAAVPAKIYELATWQMGKLGPADTLPWLLKLPLETQTNQPVALLAVQCRDSLKDWRGLQASIAQQNWGDLELVRHAFMARALRGQDMASSAKSEWDMAFKLANNRQSLVMLLTLAAQWKWQSEGEELLWAVVNRYPSDTWAMNALNQALYMAGRTRSLMSLYSQQAKRSPSDLAIKNNLAMTALLLDAQELNPNSLAREVYEKSPTNASFASTYAFSLHLQNQNAKALKVMQAIRQKDLEDPSIAGYYGLILNSAGEKTKARSYLDWGFKARLLPEERKMFERAKAGA